MKSMLQVVNQFYIIADVLLPRISARQMLLYYSILTVVCRNQLWESQTTTMLYASIYYVSVHSVYNSK